MFVERKILQRMFDSKVQHFGYINGWKHLKDSVDMFGPDHPYTTLSPKLEGVDPDDVFSFSSLQRKKERASFDRQKNRHSVVFPMKEELSFSFTWSSWWEELTYLSRF